MSYLRSKSRTKVILIEVDKFNPQPTIDTINSQLEDIQDNYEVLSVFNIGNNFGVLVRE